MSKAEPMAHNNVKKSPKLIVKSPCNDKKRIPTSAMTEAITSWRSIHLLYMTKAIIGTTTTLTAVIKAFFDGVVYSSPTVCKANETYRMMPKTAPRQTIEKLNIFNLYPKMTSM